VFALINEAVTIIKTGEIEQKKVQKDEKKALSLDVMGQVEDGLPHVAVYGSLGKSVKIAVAPMLKSSC
jgi:hypothetical protein